ncbi:MAG: phosphatidylserine/phosphatidylglycerophosphate/cardiolipin synthase family protein, partial [Gammaproteobacteria bacterium]
IFILADDPLGRDVLSRLTKKAAQGIRVRLLLDGVGSFTLPKMLLRPLAQAGGEIAWFIPVLHRPLRGRSNLRNHRKIVIADGARVWTGGRNLAQEYLDPGSNWIDLSFCLQGPAIASYLAIFEADWHFARNQPADKPAPLSAAPAHEESSRVQVIPSGPDVADDPIYAAVLTACYEARQRIMIVTPYYVPDTGLQEALRLAALRGVVVDMILPETSNHRLADIARNRYLRELAKAGARIWLLPRVMVHAKALLVDRSFALAGSANLDIRSLFRNYEVVSSFYSASDIDWLARWMETLRERSAQHQPRPAGLLKEILEGVILLGAYEI